jgi:carboxypeptidase T
MKHRPLASPAFALLLLALAVAAPLPAAAQQTASPPAGYETYHTYAALTAELDALVAAHPDIIAKFSIGKSYQGRKIWAVKISGNVTVDEDEPEVLLDGMLHARERIGNEMAIYAIHLLVDNYETNDRIRKIVDSREIWVIPMVNPDGAEYDIAGGKFHNWRKNRQPNPGSNCRGVDLNRQFSYRWGKGGTSSGDPCSNLYRGAKPWAAPEVRAYRDFVRSRVLDGRQQIRAAIDWHSFGRLVLWPYGYTYTNLPKDMTREDYRAFVALGKQVAALNRYRPEQGSDLYITKGDSTDWLYGEQRIFAYTIELARGHPLRFYATPDEIAAETKRNRGALLHFLEQADCPYRAAGRARLNCGPLYEDFEISRDWLIDPFATDTAARGAWQRGIPQKVKTAAGIKQKKNVASGQAALVTGLKAGSKPTSNSLSGRTSALSRAVKLGAGKSWTLSFSYTFAHNKGTSTTDFLRVRILAGGKLATVFSVRGKATERNATWIPETINLDQFAGKSIKVLIEARGGANRLVEAAFDDVRIYRTK